MQSALPPRRIVELSDARLAFLKELQEYGEVIIPEEEGVQHLVSFLRELGLKATVDYLPLWALYRFRKCARFKLLVPITVRELQRRAFNRTKVEVLSSGIFVLAEAKGT